MKRKTQKLFRFNREVTLGNLLQLASFIAALVALWTNMDKRLTTVELKESFVAEERKDIKKSLATLADNQAVLARTVDRMSLEYGKQQQKSSGKASQ